MSQILLKSFSSYMVWHGHPCKKKIVSTCVQKISNLPFQSSQKGIQIVRAKIFKQIFLPCDFHTFHKNITCGVIIYISAFRDFWVRQGDRRFLWGFCEISKSIKKKFGWFHCETIAETLIIWIWSYYDGHES